MLSPTTLAGVANAAAPIAPAARPQPVRALTPQPAATPAPPPPPKTAAGSGAHAAAHDAAGVVAGPDGLSDGDTFRATPGHGNRGPKAHTVAWPAHNCTKNAQVAAPGLIPCR